ncbi:MAG: glycosyltransferase family 2 protein [candidate division WOR-3 bacterium]
MKLISIVTSCRNEEDNIEGLYHEVCAQFEKLPDYTFELIIIDNASQDRTVEILRKLAQTDPRVKVILNTRDFGHIRAPYHALLQARGDAVIGMVSDLQDPPGLIPEFVRLWEQGNKVVMGVRTKSDEPRLVFALRRFYYRLLRRISDVELVENFTGFGLYDRQVVEIIRELNDPYPYFRGLVADIALPSARVEFVQQRRKGGRTKNSLYTLFDLALLGMTSYSKLPLRLATLVGFACATLSFLVALFYFVYKLLYWRSFALGLAPLVVGIFFFSSVQLFFLGIVGEYVGSIHTYVRKMPPVVEKERINF